MYACKRTVPSQEVTNAYVDQSEQESRAAAQKAAASVAVLKGEISTLREKLERAGREAVERVALVEQRERDARESRESALHRLAQVCVCVCVCICVCVCLSVCRYIQIQTNALQLDVNRDGIDDREKLACMHERMNACVQRTDARKHACTCVYTHVSFQSRKKKKLAVEGGREHR